MVISRQTMIIKGLMCNTPVSTKLGCKPSSLLSANKAIITLCVSHHHIVLHGVITTINGVRKILIRRTQDLRLYGDARREEDIVIIRKVCEQDP